MTIKVNIPARKDDGKNTVDRFYEEARRMGRMQASGLSHMKLLGLLFIGMKLCGALTWSWWLVLLPYALSFAGRMLSTWATAWMFAAMARVGVEFDGGSAGKDRRVPVNG